jgi:hypothetical protein
VKQHSDMLGGGGGVWRNLNIFSPLSLGVNRYFFAAAICGRCS